MPFVRSRLVIAQPKSHHSTLLNSRPPPHESPVTAPSDVSGALDLPSAPADFALHQCTPNPFNPITHIKYGLPEQAFVTLSVYSADRKLVATLVDELGGDAAVSTGPGPWRSGTQR